jgi:kynureninase
LYVRYVDVVDAVERLVTVMETESYRDTRFALRTPVT